MAKKAFPFWYESNQWFKPVKNLKELKQLFAVYDEVSITKEDILDKSMECERDGSDPDRMPKFGLTRECDGKQSLREYLDKHHVAHSATAPTL